MALHRTGGALNPFTNLLQVKVEVKNLAEFSKLAKYCKLTLLQDELERAYNKANEFGEKGLTSILDSIIVLLQC